MWDEAEASRRLSEVCVLRFEERIKPQAPTSNPQITNLKLPELPPLDLDPVGKPVRPDPREAALFDGDLRLAGHAGAPLGALLAAERAVDLEEVVALLALGQRDDALDDEV